MHSEICYRLAQNISSHAHDLSKNQDEFFVFNLEYRCEFTGRNKQEAPHQRCDDHITCLDYPVALQRDNERRLFPGIDKWLKINIKLSQDSRSTIPVRNR